MTRERWLNFAKSLRFIMLFGAFGAAFGAILMFWKGGTKMVSGFKYLLAGDSSKTVIASIMGGTDAFLFGIVLVIFTYAIVFGFVFDLTDEERRGLPEWMRAKGITDLKETLVSVVLVYLVVDFATDWPESDLVQIWLIVGKAISIFLLAAAFRLLPMTTVERELQKEAHKQEAYRKEFHEHS
jgi:uncharacterized membrane protein YqhA